MGGACRRHKFHNPTHKYKLQFAYILISIPRVIRFGVKIQIIHIINWKRLGAIGRQDDFLVSPPGFDLKRESETRRDEIVIKIFAPFPGFAKSLEVDAAQSPDGTKMHERRRLHVFA